MPENLPAMYDTLAEWWPLLSPPEDYAEEAAFFGALMLDHVQGGARTVLELGCGGGHNAVHLKRDFQLVLTDISAPMLRQSQRLNPECTHVQGDMRTLRLDSVFDAVFVHDAVDYMLTEADLRAAMATAFIHCRPGGVAVFAPDNVVESFMETTVHGGSDAGPRGARYLEWTYDPDPEDTQVVMDFACLLRGADGVVTGFHDRHVCGLFPHAAWMKWLGNAGFRVQSIHDHWGRDIFIAARPAQ